MSSPSDSEPNPYAPPTSECLAEVATDKRPASNKWALVFFGVAIFTFSSTSILSVYTKGWIRTRDNFLAADTLQLVRPLLALAAFISMVAIKRHVSSYYAAVIGLSLYFYSAVKALVVLVKEDIEMPGEAFVINFIISGFLIALFIRLLFRFTFGRPNREYYGLTPTPASENAARDS